MKIGSGQKLYQKAKHIMTIVQNNEKANQTNA